MARRRREPERPSPMIWLKPNALSRPTVGVFSRPEFTGRPCRACGYRLGSNRADCYWCRYAFIGYVLTMAAESYIAASATAATVELPAMQRQYGWVGP